MYCLVNLDEARSGEQWLLSPDQYITTSIPPNTSTKPCELAQYIHIFSILIYIHSSQIYCNPFDPTQKKTTLRLGTDPLYYTGLPHIFSPQYPNKWTQGYNTTPPYGCVSWILISPFQREATQLDRAVCKIGLSFVLACTRVSHPPLKRSNITGHVLIVLGCHMPYISREPTQQPCDDK